MRDNTPNMPTSEVTMLVYDRDTETVHPVGKPAEHVARACPSVGDLFALAPDMAEAIEGWRVRMEQDFDEPLDAWDPNVRHLWDVSEKLRVIVEGMPCAECERVQNLDGEDRMDACAECHDGSGHAWGPSDA